MEAKVQAKYVRCTPTKVRRVVDVTRGKRIVEAVNVLRFAPQIAAVPVHEVPESAITNTRFKAERDGERFDENDLFIIEMFADEGPTLKWLRPRAQGRASKILKRIGHITVIVGDKSDVVTKEGAR